MTPTLAINLNISIRVGIRLSYVALEVVACAEPKQRVRRLLAWASVEQASSPNKIALANRLTRCYHAHIASNSSHMTFKFLGASRVYSICT